MDFLGIWDTVKAYGWIRPMSFPAPRHNPSVLKVRHAAALDEQRALFQVTGWGDSKPGDHTFHDTVSVHHTVETRMLAGDKRYTLKRLSRRSHRSRSLQVVQLQRVADLDVASP